MTRSGSYPAAITKDAQINEAATSWLYQDLLDFFFFWGGEPGKSQAKPMQSHPWREAIGFESLISLGMMSPHRPGIIEEISPQKKSFRR